MFAPLVLVVPILIVAGVFDEWSHLAGTYGRWAMLVVDAVWGAAMLWRRLRRIHRSEHQESAEEGIESSPVPAGGHQ
ncbi:hypothetical protein AB0F91_21600 [Amycolatopsis sp. NPDC023774]|uniref:hypothetical protein n=1 Tax=Amycolatopsis sp. NPDC023774 TaxID=3155015 RepID=UPI0033C8A35A